LRWAARSCANLDAKLRVEARAFISNLHQRLGTTFIYVTHDQVEAMTMGERIAVLRAGELMQIDTPTNLYDHPANVFVAGFIGSPAMNFFDVTLITEDGKLYADCKDFRVQVPEDHYPAYKPHLGKQLLLGVRPEHVHDPEYAPPGIKPAMVEAQVEVTELMGNEVVAYFATKNTQFQGRLDPRTNVRVGMTKGCVFDMSRMHIFDKETEKAIR